MYRQVVAVDREYQTIKATGTLSAVQDQMLSIREAETPDSQVPRQRNVLEKMSLNFGQLDKCQGPSMLWTYLAIVSQKESIT